MLMRTDTFRDLDRLTQQLLGTPARPSAMPMDAYRHGDHFVVEVDLPGVEASSIDLTVEKNVLTIHGERKRTAGDDVELLMGERPHGTFSRQLFLSDSLDSDRIEASYTDGVLTVRLPVAERAKPRRISIEGAVGGPTAIDATSEDTTGSAASSRSDELVGAAS